MRFLVLGLTTSLLVAACGDATTSTGEAGTGGAGPGAGPGGAATGGSPGTSGAGDGGGGGATEVFCDPGLPVVSFAADVQPILTASCAKTNCHSGAAPDEGLSLMAGQSHAELVGAATSECSGTRTRVAAGDPAESYLFDKVRGVDLCGTSKRMPPPLGPMLSQSDRDVLEA